MNYKKIAFGTIAFFVSSFIIQGMLGFALGGEYFTNMDIMRNPPIFPLSLGQAILSGIGFAMLYPFTNFTGSTLFKGLKYGLLIGLIMVPFIALDLPGRFMIPSAGTWIWIQGLLGVLHFAIAGIAVAFIYGRDG